MSIEIKIFNELSYEQVEFIAESNYNYWKKINPLLNHDESTGNIIGMKNNVDKLPIGFALIEDNEIFGFCTLRENRLKNYLDINPWLCNVMIFEKYRKKGNARKMVDFACEKIKTFGYKKIYAWTDQAPDFYKKLSWKYEMQVQKNEGGEAMLFSKEL